MSVTTSTVSAETVTAIATMELALGKSKARASRSRGEVAAHALCQQVTLMHACIGASLVTAKKSEVGVLLASLITAGVSKSRSQKLVACAVDPAAHVLVKGAKSVETMLVALKGLKIATVSALNMARKPVDIIGDATRLGEKHAMIALALVGKARDAYEAARTKTLKG